MIAYVVWAINFIFDVRSDLQDCLEIIMASKPCFLLWSQIVRSSFKALKRFVFSKEEKPWNMDDSDLDKNWTQVQLVIISAKTSFFSFCGPKFFSYEGPKLVFWCFPKFFVLVRTFFELETSLLKPENYFCNKYFCLYRKFVVLTKYKNFATENFWNFFYSFGLPITSLLKPTCKALECEMFKITCWTEDNISGEAIFWCITPKSGWLNAQRSLI